MSAASPALRLAALPALPALLAAALLLGACLFPQKPQEPAPSASPGPFGPSDYRQDDDLLHAIRTSESRIGGPATLADEGPLLDCNTEPGICIGTRVSDLSASSLERRGTDTDKLTILLRPSTVADLETLTKLPWVTRLRLEPAGKL